MGYTIRTNKYRYTAWLSFKSETKLPDWNDIIAEELYNHNNDEGENRNIATFQKYVKLKKKLKFLLQHGWKNILSNKSIYYL